ncbi:MAG TPA: Fe-S cluster domain-containing protein [Bacteroidales bacterium]|nr:Fe-S cluster domain-containing protein [Bacteroidales bacterium]HRR92449.1 Fe-S cluster domain-containing protein [Bacteroidales bacterium]
MGHTVLLTVISLGSVGLVAALILYFISQKFKVYEDPRIDQIQEALPGANCGGCGFTGCRNFAEALVKADTLDGLNCPVGGASLMADVAKILGKEAVAADPLVAVVRCQGSYEHRPRTSVYDGVKECSAAHYLYGGETDCHYGCLGYGDCVRACNFDAMYMDEKTGLPVIIDEKCVACGACVRACPRDIIELRKKAKKDRKIFVSCVNCDKGGPARKACRVACIACNKCYNVCEFDAITIKDNLAYIDSFKCTFCRKCVVECPTNAIIETNFPPRKVKAETVEEEKKE